MYMANVLTKKGSCATEIELFSFLLKKLILRVKISALSSFTNVHKKPISSFVQSNQWPGDHTLRDRDR